MTAWSRRIKVRVLAASGAIVVGSFCYARHKSPEKNAAAVAPIKSPFVWSSIPNSIAAQFMPPFPENGVLWNSCSTLVLGSLGILSKTFMSTCINAQVYHQDNFIRILHNPARTQGIVTVSNHGSVWDDPVLWGSLPSRMYWNIHKVRWVLAAADICYTNPPKSLFFSLGQCIPTMRGSSIYQPAVDFAIHKVSHGEWIHVFPESRVNQKDPMIRFKWGVGRIIMEADPTPIIVPIWHYGMEQVRPLRGAFVQLFKPVTIVYGDPVDVDDILKAWKAGLLSETEARIQITTRCYDALDKLNARTKEQMNAGKDV